VPLNLHTSLWDCTDLFADRLTLKINTICSFETSAIIYKLTRRSIPEDMDLQ